MQKYHIATIANLLLDMDFAVEDRFLTDNNLEKGIQTMVDDAQHRALLQALKAHEPKMAAGGACSNAIFAAATLGAKTAVNGRIGSDDQADVLAESLASAGITTNDDSKLRTDGDTGKCILLVTPDAERTMLTYLGVSSQIPLSTVNIETVLESEYFLVEGFQCIPDETRETNLKALQLAKGSGVKIALSLCDEAVVEYFNDQIWQFINAAPVDILFCNEHEAKWLTKCETLDEAIQKIHSIAKEFVITKGANGALVWDGSTMIEIPGVAAEAIDTTGAGDIFVGVFLWAITHGFDHRAAGSLANKAASRLVCQYGPRLSSQELKTVFNEFQHDALGLKESADVVG